MSNSMTQIDTLEYVGIDVTSTGFNHPACAVRQGLYFGWGGSGSRSSTLVTALAVRFQLREEALTIAAAASTTTTNTSILPVDSLIHAVLGRVTTVIPTAATFNVGDATQGARFKGSVAVAAGTTFSGFDCWNPALASQSSGPQQSANAGVRITPNLTPGAATGVVALQVFSETFIPPTA